MTFAQDDIGIAQDDIGIAQFLLAAIRQEDEILSEAKDDIRSG